jgi:hypothetical protein
MHSLARPMGIGASTVNHSLGPARTNQEFRELARGYVVRRRLPYASMPRAKRITSP